MSEKTPRNSSPLSAGQAVDKLRALKQDCERDAELAYKRVMERLPERTAAIRARVSPAELPILDMLLKVLDQVSEPAPTPPRPLTLAKSDPSPPIDVEFDDEADPYPADEDLRPASKARGR